MGRQRGGQNDRQREGSCRKRKVKWVDGALINTFNSIIISIIIDYYKQLTQELSHTRAMSEASSKPVGMSLSHASRLRLITLTMEAPQAPRQRLVICMVLRN